MSRGRSQPLAASLATFALLLAVACDRPVATSLSDLEGCPVALHGRRVTVEGYLGVNRREGALVRGSDKGQSFYLVALTAEPGARSSVSAAIDSGPGANRMDELPAGNLITTDDESCARLAASLRVRTADGRTAGPNDRVRVTGVYGAACILRVETVEFP